MRARIPFAQAGIRARRRLQSGMRLPIRNKSGRPLTIFVEPVCSEFEVPVGGEAIVRLEDGPPHSIEVDDAWVTIWDEGLGASVEIVSSEDKRVDEALMLARVWLYQFGAESEAKLIDRTVEVLEPVEGYLSARLQVFRAFHGGFLNGEQGHPADFDAQNPNLAACYRAGMVAARLNRAARENRSFPELSAAAPLDTDTVRSAFARALANSG
jgi:hypothetical protein